MGTFIDTRCVVNLNDADMPGDVIDALAVGTFASGALPWARTVRVERVRPEATLRPAGTTVAREAVDTWHTVQLVEGDDWLLWVTRRDDRSATLSVFAPSAEVGQPVLDAATGEASEPEPESADPTASIGFWHLANGPERRARRIAVSPWPVIRPNYSSKVAAAFDDLMAVDPDHLCGRLLLLHGPPGTGKTTALRALAHAWEGWCQFDYVLDPEKLLTTPGYLMSAALSHAGQDEYANGDRVRSWRLLLLEDCDELITPGAKSDTGQALSRLLNLTDGLLGQGIDLLVAISTNEPLAKLHPAVVRPGRCLAQVEVGRIPPAEARRWLGRPADIPAEGATLAELYALRGELRTLTHTDDLAVGGLYL